MASIDMCEHDWPGTGCKECKREKEANETWQAREIERLSKPYIQIRAQLEQEWCQLRALQDAVKAQPSGVVLPEPDFYWVEADEGSWNSPEEWAQDYYDYNGEKPESVSFSCAVKLPTREYDSFEFDGNGNCISCRLVDAPSAGSQEKGE